MVRRPGHRLGPPASLAPDLTRPPPIPTTPAAPGRPWNPAPTRAPSGTPPCPRPPSHHKVIHNSDDHGPAHQRE
jgi:hypothetical protein